ncbi:MAG TPA: large conductance mechanosensitive channel protein MscL [Actinomycetales bacterium]|nr:large conductance mechanosensitive channel protein MscL [Actinomycetales bacterium]
MLKGFKDFLMRGNVVDLAVAVVIGTAFATLVSQFTESFINPLIKLVGGGGVSGGSFTVNDVKFDWAAFVNAVIYFVIVAAVVYFFVVVPMNHLLKRLKRDEEPEPEAPSPDTVLLTEIRDLLRAQRGTPGATGGRPIDPGSI